MSVSDFARRYDAFCKALESEGRDRAEVTVSTVIRSTDDPAGMIAEAEAYAAAGADLAIVSLSKERAPGQVEELAEVLRPLATGAGR